MTDFSYFKMVKDLNRGDIKAFVDECRSKGDEEGAKDFEFLLKSFDVCAPNAAPGTTLAQAFKL